MSKLLALYLYCLLNNINMFNFWKEKDDKRDEKDFEIVRKYK